MTEDANPVSMMKPCWSSSAKEGIAMETEFRAMNWTPLYGKWATETDLTKYLGKHPGDQLGDPSVGLTLSNQRARNGRIEVKVRFLSAAREREARLVFKCDASTEEYFAAGLGGWRHAYCLHYGKGRAAFTLLAGTGSSDVLLDKDEYQISVHVAGRVAVLSVDGNEVLREILPRELAGDRLGLYSYEDQQVEFTDLQVTPYRPKAFVIMQFGEPFDSLYSEVIKPDSDQDSEKAVFDVHRADETLGPGSIPEDIVRNLIDADLVIAEISSTRKQCYNANVFYELGYAHSLLKPTILLVRKPTKLPFDIAHHRVIFYEDSPHGRLKLKNELRKHLEASVASPS
jgi:hypothetical protein